jgi:hypothetical protein
LCFRCGEHNLWFFDSVVPFIIFQFPCSSTSTIFFSFLLFTKALRWKIILLRNKILDDYREHSWSLNWNMKKTLNGLELIRYRDSLIDELPIPFPYGLDGHRVSRVTIATNYKLHVFLHATVVSRNNNHIIVFISFVFLCFSSLPYVLKPHIPHVNYLSIVVSRRGGTLRRRNKLNDKIKLTVEIYLFYNGKSTTFYSTV